jgi:hypothetical protein
MVQELAITDENTIDIKQKRLARHILLDSLLFNTPYITDTLQSSREKLSDSRNNSGVAVCKVISDHVPAILENSRATLWKHS